MMTEKVTHLTHGALKSIVENQDSTTQYVVQILHLEEKNDMYTKNGNLSLCMCSDGFAKMNMYVLNLSASILSTISKYKPIIQIQELKMRQQFFIIIRHEVIYLDKGPIGQPIIYEDYKKLNYTNPNGNTEIQFAKAPHTLQFNSQKRQSFIQQSQFQQEKQLNDNYNFEQEQVKSGIKLSFQKQQQESKHITQKIQDQIYQPTSDSNLLKISELYPGMRGFKIKGRIVSKSDVTPFKNGKGHLFTIEIIDSEKSIIQGVFFNKTCDQFHNSIEAGQVYYFQNGQVKTNKYISKYQNQVEYQIHFEEFSKITHAKDDKDIDMFPFSIKTIDDIDSLQVEDKCDVLGVIVDVKPMTQIMTRSNENRAKKNIILSDQTQRGIDIVIWGAQAEKWQFQKDEIVAFRGLKVYDYQNIRSLSVTNSTTYEKNLTNLEQINGFKEFYQFYLQNKDYIELKPKEYKKMQQLSYIEQIKKDFEGVNPKKSSKFYEINAYITTIFNKTFQYEGCDQCRKKVYLNQQTNQFHCQNCNQSFDKPSYKYIFAAKIADTTGNLITSVTNDAGQKILNISCDDYQKINDDDKADYLRRACFQQFRFLVLAKMETYNDENKARFQIINVLQEDIYDGNQELYKSIIQVLNIN